MKKFCLILLIGIVFVFLVNCRNKDNRMVIKFPESFYNKQHNNCLQSKSKFKVINYISVDCSVCFNVIKEWHTLLKKNKLPDNFNVCFITYGEQKDVFSYYLDKLSDNPFSFYEDINNEFISINPIKDLEFYKTVLLNENNEVLLVGNPFDNKVIMDKYKKLGVIQ